MTTFYDHQKLEKKWQAEWERSGQNLAGELKGEKKYILDMFPYPSADGLHVGHPESYTATDIMARYYRFKGCNVLHPIGFDAFGLPAENYAIKKGVHPKIKTQENMETFRRQIKSLGFSYDWSREIITSSPDYYRWTQWLFLQLYKKGLAYKKQAPVNWCDSCKTVLANEQVVDDKCERCENEVIQKDLEQWFFKVTDYAEELLEKIADLDWSEALKATQKNWIGKSEGAEIKFNVQHLTFNIQVFTTRPDTLFGATYLVLAPEHGIIKDLRPEIENWDEVEKYVNQARLKNKLERTDLVKEKTGVELKGIRAVNPATKKEIPIWLADYVLTDYGTGAIMAVPAHDQRDFEFAKKYNLPMVEVIEGGEKGKCYVGEGKLINSDKFNGLSSEEAKDKIIKFVGGKKQVQYKIRDWLVSRQRYWGAPIPIIYCDKCGTVPVPEKDLPVVLPDDVDFKPTGESPLKSSKSFNNVKCPNCGGAARREADTMDTFVCSAWYFLRYADAHNQKEAFSKKAVKYWLPVDLYIGGMEHAVGHLIYSRFIVKALRDLGHLKFDEPFLKMRNQGIILAEDGRKMSKRWGNVINPDEVVEAYGADTMRMYEMFMGPLEDMKPWSQQGIIGIRRFLEKVYKYINSKSEIKRTKQIQNSEFKNQEIEKLLHKTVKKVTEDIEALKFNTAISSMMEYMNFVTRHSSLVTQEQSEKFLIILSPFAPHLAEELWESLGHKESIFTAKWPDYDKKLIMDEEIIVAVQINGKLRGEVKVARGSSQKEIEKSARSLANVKSHLQGKEIKKVIYLQDKLINLVVN
jgi:leucyl-tRNA synthetase